MAEPEPPPCPHDEMPLLERLKLTGEMIGYAGQAVELCREQLQAERIGASHPWMTDSLRKTFGALHDADTHFGRVANIAQRVLGLKEGD